MAKKKTTTTSSSNYSTVKVCAFVGLVLAGVAGIISFVIWLLNLLSITIAWANTARSICNIVSQVALFITVWLAAWDYVKHKNATWKVIYFIFLVLGILGLCGLSFFN